MKNKKKLNYFFCSVFIFFALILFLFAGPAFADDYIVVIQSPFHYGVWDAASSRQDLATLEKMASKNGYQIALLAPSRFAEIYPEFLEKVPENARITSIVIAGHV